MRPSIPRVALIVGSLVAECAFCVWGSDDAKDTSIGDVKSLERGEGLEVENGDPTEHPVLKAIIQQLPTPNAVPDNLRVGDGALV